MLRIVFAMIIGGGVLCFIGYQEHKLSKDTSAEPVSVSLSALENGVKPPNKHIEIGEHVAIYDALVYEYEQSGYGLVEPGPNTRVKSTFYPIVSPSHPLAKVTEALSKVLADAKIEREAWEELNDGQLQEASDKAATGDATTAEESLSAEMERNLNNIKVIVRSRRFRTIGDLPHELCKREEAVKGLIVNQISSLGRDEIALLRESFPEINVNELLIVQENRQPMSTSGSYGLMGGGGLLILVGVTLLLGSKSL